jgi:hypothetical protein
MPHHPQLYVRAATVATRFPDLGVTRDFGERPA